MAHADDATKAWVSAIPTKNASGNVIEWKCQYKYTLNSFSHIFNERIRIESPSKAPASYTKAELLTLMNKPHLDDMFNKKYTVNASGEETKTEDDSFDVSTLEDA